VNIINELTQTSSNILENNKRKEEDSNINFSNMLREKQDNSEPTQKEKSEESINDLFEQLSTTVFSLLRKGISEEEIKKFEDLLNRIKDEIKENGVSKNNIEKILKMYNEVKEMISSMKTVSIGQTILNTDSEQMAIDENYQKEQFAFLSKFDETEDILNDILKSYLFSKKDNTTAKNSEELKIIEELKKLKN